MKDVTSGSAAVAPLPNRTTTAVAALDVLAECESAAADRRALAENQLAAARGLEAQLSDVRQTISPLAAAAEAALANERSAEARARISHESVVQAQLDDEAARRAFAEAQAARRQADAGVAEVHAHLEALSKTHGLSADAAQRIVERRLADTQRDGAIRT